MFHLRTMSMEPTPRETAFLLDEMRAIEADESRYPTVRAEARRLRKRAETALRERPARGTPDGGLRGD